MRVAMMMVLTGLLSACGVSDGNVGDITSIVEASAEDNGRTLHLPLGAELRVTVPDNKTIPWQLKVTSLPRALRTTGEKFTGEGSGAVGAGGTTTFHFRAERRGTGQLRIAHLSSGGETERFNATIVVD